MMSLKSLKVLLWANERRLSALQAQLAELRRAGDAAAAVAAQADQLHGERQADMQHGDAQLARLLDAAALRPEHLVVQQQVRVGLQAQCAAADSACVAARQRVQQADAQCVEARGAVQRVESQRDQLVARRVQLLRDADAAQEDTQDEESEEAAVSRRVGQCHDAERLAVLQAGP
jgi:chromosome segregation ATPase